MLHKKSASFPLFAFSFAPLFICVIRCGVARPTTMTHVDPTGPRTLDVVPSFISTRCLDDIKSAVLSLCNGDSVNTIEDPDFPTERENSLSFEVPPTIVRDQSNDGGSTVPLPKSRSVLSMRSELGAGGENDTLTLTSGASPVGPQPPEAPAPAPPPPKRPRVLCVWDVDDTLVATGSTGVRQCEVFRQEQLSALFKAVGAKGNRVRHLLLSQGSIDDVFADDSTGKLSFLKKYFEPPRPAKAPASGKPSSSDAEKPRGMSSIFSCKSTKSKEPRSKDTDTHKGKGDHEGTKSSSSDLRDLEPGAVLVRLTNIKGTPEKEGDAAFLRKASFPHEDASVTELERGRKLRWLVLRPQVWGITLASLNTIIPPSPTNAFVDGKCFRKMDVVWSLACTGEWDSVFFVDNNLSELGVVKFGMQLNTAVELQATHRMYKFYQSDYLLLATSAMLRRLEAQYNRDITAPPAVDSVASAGPKPQARDGDGSGGDSESASGSGLEPDEVPSPVVRQTTAAATDATMAPPPPAGEEANPASDGGRSSNGATRTSEGSYAVEREVHLVVAHLHLPSAEYRKVIRGDFNADADAAFEGARSRQNAHARRGNARQQTRVIGQPTFAGDTSLTDEQYEFVLKYFRHEESKLYQLMSEDMKANGYVDVGGHHHWHPSPQYVHRRLFPRPRRIECLHNAFAPIALEVDERLARPLSTVGKLVSTEVQQDAAMVVYTRLLREMAFIDPVLTNAVANTLYNMRNPDTRDAVSKSVVHALQKEVAALTQLPVSTK